MKLIEMIQLLFSACHAGSKRSRVDRVHAEISPHCYIDTIYICILPSLVVIDVEEHEIERSFARLRNLLTYADSCLVMSNGGYQKGKRLENRCIEVK